MPVGKMLAMPDGRAPAEKLGSEMNGRSAPKNREGAAIKHAAHHLLASPAATRNRPFDFSRIPLSSQQARQPATVRTNLPPCPAHDLRIGAVDSELEREADRFADQITQPTAPVFAPSPAPLQVSRKCAACQQAEQEENNLVHRKPDISAHPSSTEAPAQTAPASVHDVLRSPGAPLSLATRSFFEPRLRTDLSRVRVHTDSAAAASARSISAQAYAINSHIVFARDLYAPGTPAGKHLLAHELAHVAQERRSTQGPQPTIRRQSNAASAVPPPPTPLQVRAERLARLALGPASRQAQPRLNSPVGPVVTLVRDSESGEIFAGLNLGVPDQPTSVIKSGIKRQQQRVAAGVSKGQHTVPPGTHADVNALDQAIAAREGRIGRAITQKELSTFEMHNVWLKGQNRVYTTAARCEHCREITNGVKVTDSVVEAEAAVDAAAQAATQAAPNLPQAAAGAAEQGAVSTLAQAEEATARVLTEELPIFGEATARELAADIAKAVVKQGAQVTKGVIIGIIAGIISDKIVHGNKPEQEQNALDKANHATPASANRGGDFLFSAIPHPLLQVAAATAARLVTDLLYSMVQGDREKRLRESQENGEDLAGAARADKAADAFENGANFF